MSLDEHQRLADAVERLLNGMLGDHPGLLGDIPTLCDVIYECIAGMPVANKWSFLEDLRNAVEERLR